MTEIVSGAPSGMYLDCAATAPLTVRAREAWLQATECMGNPSSSHSHGTRAAGLLDQARREVALCLDCPTEEIIFTSGGTESNALAIVGRALAGTGRRTLVTSAIEHSSVLGATHVAARFGLSAHQVRPNSAGVVEVERVLAAVDESTVLISIQHANNETGVIQPVEDIAAAVNDYGRAIALHCDAVHTAGKLDLGRLPAMMLSLSAHKFGGPRGVGILRIPGGAHGAMISSVLRGGTQEFGIRAGTENVAGSVACATALTESMTGLEAHRTKVRHIRQAFTDVFRAAGWQPTSCAQTVDTTLSGRFPEIRGDTLMYALDCHGISISTGSACHSDSHSPSHVLSSMGLSEQQMSETVRISFGGSENIEDIVHIASRIVAEVRRLRSLAD